MKNYYKILGVSESASVDEIKRAHKNLYVKNHPDRFKTPKEKADAQSLCKDINEAYYTLIDPKKRQQYDLERSGNYGGYSEYSGQPYYTEYGNTFEFDIGDLFNKARYRKQKQVQQIELDIQIKHKLDLKTAYYGTKLTVEYNKYKTCGQCEGRSVIMSQNSCKTCRGAGYIVMIFSIPCNQCNGTGKQTIPCTSCKQTGYISTKAKCICIIPAKVYNGQKLRFSKQGHSIMKNIGDLFLIVELTSVEGITFDHEGNLYMEKKLDLEHVLQRLPVEVVLFNEIFKIELPAVLNSKTRLQVNRRGLIQAGELKHLFINLVVEYPKKL